MSNKEKVKDILLNDGYMSPLLVDDVVSKILEVFAIQIDPEVVAKMNRIQELKKELEELEGADKKAKTEVPKEEEVDMRAQQYKLGQDARLEMGDNGIMQIRRTEKTEKRAKSIVANPDGIDVSPAEAEQRKIGTPSVKIAPFHAGP